MIASLVTGEEEFSGKTESIEPATIVAVESSERRHGAARWDNAGETAEFVFVLPNDQARIAPVVEFLAAEATRVSKCEALEQMRISLALEEALVNALYHGNFEIDSDSVETKQMCRHDVAHWRRTQRPYCDRHIRVLATIARHTAVFVIRDDGRGFDPSRLPDPTADENLERTNGRGIFLMRSLMDNVTFNEIGNEVTLVRRWSP